MLSADASSLRKMAKALRQARPDILRATQKSMRGVGAKVAAKVRDNASWSTRIPQTVRVSASGVNTVVVRAGGPKAPHAKPIEHAGASGKFRHPVFGNRQNWVKQDARPFLHPAATSDLQAYAEELAAALKTQVEEAI